jgi:hypothetical protein
LLFFFSFVADRRRQRCDRHLRQASDW